MTRQILKILCLVGLAGICLSGLHCGPRGGESGYKNPGDSRRRQARSPTADTTPTCARIKAMSTGSEMKRTDELEKRFLAVHNEVRRLFNLDDLTWDNNLAAYALRWAQWLKANNNCTMKHRSKANITENKKYGENLAFNWISTAMPAGKFNFTPEKVVKSWSKECEHYNYEQNTCVAGEQCGHYTQVIWHNSQRVGCTMVTCDGNENPYNQGRAELWVCNYDPPGNYIGQKPY